VASRKAATPTTRAIGARTPTAAKSASIATTTRAAGPPRTSWTRASTAPRAIGAGGTFARGVRALGRASSAPAPTARGGAGCRLDPLLVLVRRFDVDATEELVEVLSAQPCLRGRALDVAAVAFHERRDVRALEALEELRLRFLVRHAARDARE